VGPAQANKWHGVAIGLTLDRLVVEVQPGGHRRAAAAEQRRRDCRSSDGVEDRDGVRQCVALVAPRCPREGARWVTRLGEPAERQARR
jgi:hypothetical protein